MRYLYAFFSFSYIPKPHKTIQNISISSLWTHFQNFFPPASRVDASSPERSRLHPLPLGLFPPRLGRSEAGCASPKCWAGPTNPLRRVDTQKAALKPWNCRSATQETFFFFARFFSYLFLSFCIHLADLYAKGVRKSLLQLLCCQRIGQALVVLLSHMS